jgi:hypothetical protein
MSTAGGTARGAPAPKNRNNVQFLNSPSALPRPPLEHAPQSEAGTSTISTSRQKMSKRDEVSPSP